MGRVGAWSSARSHSSRPVVAAATTAAAAEGSEDVTGDISVMAIWGGEEQESFQAVIDGFDGALPERQRQVHVRWRQPCAVALDRGRRRQPARHRGDRPARADGSSSPSRARSSRSTIFARRSSTTSANPSRTSARSTARSTGSCSRAPTSRPCGTTSPSFEEAGVGAPETWDELNEPQRHAQGRGDHPYSVGVDVGWPMTDIFENIYLRTAGPEMYDQLGAHEIPWTDQSVKDALTFMAATSSATRHTWPAAPRQALQTEMPDSVAKVFTDSPEAAMVIIGDFAPGVSETTLEPESGYNVFHVPVDRRLGACGGRRRRHLRPVQGQPGGRRVPRVPDDGGGSGDLGGARRILVAEQEPRPRRLPGRDHADDGRRPGRGRGVPLRPVRPAAVGLRRHAGTGLFKAFTDFVRTRTTSTGCTQQMEADATKAYSQ